MLKERKSREHLSLFGMISTRGDLCWQIQRVPFKSDDFEDFFTWLSTEETFINTKMLIVWDGATIHKGEAVKNFLRNNPGMIHLEALPPYCPQLNAIELLWDYLKCQKLKNQVFLNLNDLQKAVEKALNEIADDPELIRSFFQKGSVSFP